jgi:predicted DNA-binding transcriptional regulator AlpA
MVQKSSQAAIAKRAAELRTAAKIPSGTPLAIRAADQKHAAKAALAADLAHAQHDRHHVHGARAPPGVRLLDKTEVCAITNVSFVTVWAWMRAGAFPRSRVVGGKSMWLSTDIDAWIAGLPLRPLKGDAEAASIPMRRRTKTTRT